MASEESFRGLGPFSTFVEDIVRKFWLLERNSSIWGYFDDCKASLMLMRSAGANIGPFVVYIRYRSHASRDEMERLCLTNTPGGQE